jgi:hypothetical protein
VPEKIFISYTACDDIWAHWIGTILLENGYEVFVHEWEVGAGENIPLWMNERLQLADRVLGVFTDAYLAREFSKSEQLSAYWADPEGRKGRLIPVEVAPVSKWPPLVSVLRRITICDLPEHQAERKLLDFLKPPGAPAVRPTFPGKLRNEGLTQNSHLDLSAPPLERRP